MTQSSTTPAQNPAPPQTPHGHAATDPSRFERTRLPPPPPACPEGWRIAPPDFVGVGTMRSGTSWWHYLVSRHPSVTRPPSRDKELHFFDRFAFGGAPDPAEYHRYFPRPEGHLAGEWTPRYAADHWTPQLLKAAAPDARILIALRDPVERFISGLSYVRRDGPEPGTTAVNLQVYRSLYWTQLQNLLNYFPREQILVLQYEKCVADTEGELNRTFDFLGADPALLPFHPGLRRPRNELRTERIPLTERDRKALRAALRSDLHLLAADFPELDQSLWPTSSYINT